MDRSLKLRTLGLVALLALCGLLLLPSLVGKKNMPAALAKVFDSEFNLGSDLRGGVHFVYSINLDRAISDKGMEIKRSLDLKFSESATLKDNVTISTPFAGAVNATVKDATMLAEVKAAFTSDYGSTLESAECPATADASLTTCYRVSNAFAEATRRSALRNAVQTIRERIDEKGIAEPTVVEKGDDIIVELPGLSKESIQRVRSIIARTAKLEFRIVDEDGEYMRALYAHLMPAGTPAQNIEQGIPMEPEAAAAKIRTQAVSRTSSNGASYNGAYLEAENRKEAISLAEAKEHDLECERDEKGKVIEKNGMANCTVPGRYVIQRYLKSVTEKNPALVIPDDREVGFQLEEVDGKQIWRTVYLEKQVRLTGSAVSEATKFYDGNTGRPEVQVQFNAAGERLFAETTGSNIGRLMAIILDDKVMSAPEIKTRISANASISVGGATAQDMEREADDLVAVLKTGSLPAPLKEESSSEFGPTLGLDAVNKAKYTFGVGILLVVLIMVYFYRASGWVSIIAVSINVLMMMAAMAMFGATLTLPGIAAIVLTVGMAVDGNILIYERMRDELVSGKSVRGAVELGFGRAFSAILDGQLTTAAAGWVLFTYGSGPIKGFAVMLLVGIVTTLFTNVWVSRLFFDLYLSRKEAPTTLSI